MQAVLTWTPATNISQDIQYRTISGTTTWNLFSSLGPSANTETITGLLDNRIYEFRVVNNCSNGGVAYSNLDTDVKLTCPTVSYTMGSTLNFYSFTHLGGDITKYEVLIYASDGTTLLSTNIHDAPSGTVNGSFTSTASTTYKVEVRVYAGNAPGIYTYSKVCPQDTVVTLGSDPVDAYISVYGEDSGGQIVFTAYVTSGTTLDNITFEGEIYRYSDGACITPIGSECPFTSVTLPSGNTTISSGNLCATSTATTLKVITLVAATNSITSSPQQITIGSNTYVITDYGVCTGL